MRTPDETAGRKGKCPNCGVKVQIPESSLAMGSSSPPASSLGGAAAAASHPAPSQPAAAPASPPGIQFPCAQCQHRLTVPAAMAGRKGKCPQCGAVMTIPTRSEENAVAPAATRPGPAARPAATSRPASAGAQPAAQRPAPTPARPGPASPLATAGPAPTPAPSAARPQASPGIQFQCPSCQKQIRVAATLAGRQVACPACQAAIQVPAPTRRAVAGGLRPIASPATSEWPAGLTPVDDDPWSGGLTPAGGGLAPVASDPLADLFAGIPPPGQDPFASSLGTPLPATPFGQGGYPPSFGAGSLNPYAPSTSMSSPSASVAAYHAQKPKRNGLPWDRQVESGFSQTVSLVLFSPKEAFYRMSRTGGVGRPLLYCIAGTLIAFLASVGYNVALQLVAILLRGGDNLGPALGAMAIGLGVALIAGLMMSTVAVVASSFVQSGMLHLCLLMVGGARHGFETTYRVWCYTMGSSALCALVPILGGLIALGFQVAGLIVGCCNAHETSLGRAVAAVLIHFAIGCAIVGLVVFMIIGTLAAAFRAAQ
ncbi:MAG: hypothetical protein AB7O38_21215 [Pirellulaceae bacterium]